MLMGGDLPVLVFLTPRCCCCIAAVLASQVQEADGGSAWYNFNDANVTKLGSSSTVVSPSAYILFYALRPPGDYKSKKKKNKSGRSNNKISSALATSAAAGGDAAGA